jgi:polysaccharide deacetylase 2 family uncharacterized protein YibQ
MLKRLLLLCCCLLALPAMGADRVQIAIIIDDLGNNLELAEEALALPGAVTYSILPQRPFSRQIARRAHATGREVMLHLPMQSGDNRELGLGGLHLAMDREEFTRQVHASLGAVPHVVGVNNHMGSLLTREPAAMRWLMQDLSCSGELYFVDSRTDVRTVARKLAREAGLANAQRDVFLDHDPDSEAVRSQLHRLIARAQHRGSAIAIGHPYPQTLAVLAEELPRLAEQGIDLVAVSQLVEERRNTPIWHACSSPLPTVAKNSKP